MQQLRITRRRLQRVPERMPVVQNGATPVSNSPLELKLHRGAHELEAPRSAESIGSEVQGLERTHREVWLRYVGPVPDGALTPSDLAGLWKAIREDMH